MNTLLPWILLLVAFVVTNVAYPFVLKFARIRGIVDNPSARKLQRVPVPVMGGTAVFIGMATAVAVVLVFLPSDRVMKLMALLTAMYVIGVWDDIRDVSAEFRFLLELFIVWLMILLLNVELNDFHGFLGVDGLPDAISVPLSLVAGVGIINAINLIDGVDGYCSTYGMMACAVFAAVFWYAGLMPMVVLAMITIGALLPFFFHNVFGKTSKMFLGDGGSLMLGMLLAFFTFNALTTGRPTDLAFERTGLSLAALTLAVLAVPVFDTLKVMIFRLVRGQSPFHPDKTHLHHLYIEMNFSHLSTSAIIVLNNMAIIGVLLLAWWLGADSTWQVIIVILCGMGYTWGFYFFMEWQRRKNDGEGSLLFQRMSIRGQSSRTESPFWLFLRRIVDSRILGGVPPKEKDATHEVSHIIDRDPRI